MSDFFVHPSSFVDAPCEISSGVRIWHFCHIMSHCRIGEGSSLGQNVVVGQRVVLGRNVKVQNNVSIYEGVICEDDVFLGPSMVFTNVINPRSAIVRKHAFRQTLVCRGATIGANATIVCGHTIGAFSFIGAGAVVTKDVPAYALMVGNPARQIGWVSEAGHRLQFGADGTATCKETGDVYQMMNGECQKRSI